MARLGLRWTPRSPRLLAWQARHLSHWTGSGGTLGSPLDAAVAAAVGMAGVALGDIDLYFAWQA